MVMKQIQAIYRGEGKVSNLSPDERLCERQVIIKPHVDALFVYLNEYQKYAADKFKIKDAIEYPLNQEIYLRVKNALPVKELLNG